MNTVVKKKGVGTSGTKYNHRLILLKYTTFQVKSKINIMTK